MTPTPDSECSRRRPRPGFELVAVSPRQLASAILTARFGPAGQIAESLADGVTLHQHQRSAILEARRILQRRRGVFLADSVGLGKTHIALALIEETLREGGDVVLTTPASLARDWERHLSRLARKLKAPVLSGGRRAGPRSRPAGSEAETGLPLSSADEAGQTATGSERTGSVGRLALVSHTRLSRGTFNFSRLPSIELVVVDEAHAFRSPNTRRYHALAGVCPGCRVVLITATPINNSLFDLYHQIRLFAGNADFRDLGIADLDQAFRDLSTRGANPVQPWLNNLLRAVVVRRTRKLVLPEQGRVAPARAGAGSSAAELPASARPPALKFPRRAPPVAVRYELTLPGGQSALNLTPQLESLTLAALRLRDYGAALSAGTRLDPALVRVGLLKRLESSIAAFRQSIERQLRYHAQFLDVLHSGRLLPATEYRSLYSAGGDDEPDIQLVLEPLTLREAPAGLDRVRLSQDVRADLDRLIAMQQAAHGPAAARDPKLDRLLSLLDHELAGQKTVLFTEYRATARYLWHALVDRGHVGLVDGSGALLGRQACSRSGVISRFAPLSNGLRSVRSRERVELLIATDVLAEGLNLQDANCVVCYDLPWNPVRLIQRMGRVDRLGSPHDCVHLFTFLPDQQLDEMLQLMKRLRRKLSTIEETVGSEAKVLAEDSVPPEELVKRLTAGDATTLDDLERAEAAPHLPIEALRTAFLRERLSAPALELGNGRVHCAAVRLDSQTVRAGHTLVAYLVGGYPLWLVVRPDGRLEADSEAIAASILLQALKDGAPSAEPRMRRILRSTDVASAEVGRRFSCNAIPAASNFALRARKRLLRALALASRGADPEIYRRADTVLAALAFPLPAGKEAAVRNALTANTNVRAPADFLCLLAALERALRIRPDDRTEVGASEDIATGYPFSEVSGAPILLGVIETRAGPVRQGPAH